MILKTRKNGMDFRIVLCLSCERAARIVGIWLPDGWTVTSDPDTHICPVCALPDKEVIAARAAARTEKLLNGWIGQGLTDQHAGADDVEMMRQDLVSAFTEVEEQCRTT